MSARGIEAIVIDAPLETNQNGVTVERGDAVTGPDGRVYIYNGTALNPDSVLAHESVHAAVRKNKPEAHDFVSAIDQATDKSSYYYLACAQIINEAHYDGQLDLTTQEGQAAVRDEMAAYWAGAYNSKNAEELELLSCIDAQQAFTAWNAFNTFENIDAAAGKTKTGDISATTDIQNGSVPTLKAPSHTISPVSNSRIAQTGENATGFSGPAAERTSDVSAVPSALNPAPRLYTRAEVQGMSAGEVRENYDAIQESMRRGFAVGAPARRSRDGNGKIAAPVGPVTGRAVSRSEMEADLRPTSAFGIKTGSCCKARRRRRRRRKATPKISKWTWKTPR